MSDRDFFDDYIAYKMCCEDENKPSGGGKGSSSNSGCLTAIIAVVLVLSLVSLFFR